MNFYQHWARGEATVRGGRRPWKLQAYGGSNASLAEAQRRAQQIAERAAAAIDRGEQPGGYGYADRPLREEVVEAFESDGELSAAITRNSYGSLVLNVRRVMFIDVDYPERSGGGVIEGLRRMWGVLGGRRAASENGDARMLERFDSIGRELGGLSLRVYRTAGGFRLLVTSATFDPGSAETERVLTAFGSDPLYRRLCKAQDCFRARLTAKYWRCGAARPPARLPWQSVEEEARYREWERRYDALAGGYAACALVGTLGPADVGPGVEVIQELHDRLATRDGAPLA